MDSINPKHDALEMSDMQYGAWTATTPVPYDLSDHDIIESGYIQRCDVILLPNREYVWATETVGRDIPYRDYKILRRKTYRVLDPYEYMEVGDKHNQNFDKSWTQIKGEYVGYTPACAGFDKVITTRPIEGRKLADFRYEPIPAGDIIKKGDQFKWITWNSFPKTDIGKKCTLRYTRRKVKINQNNP
jgi:hypothetical protein